MDKVVVEKKQIAKCKHCYTYVAWLTSKRTGKKYPVNFDANQQDPSEEHHFEVIKNDFHKCK